ncbi:pentatricopeptide repeat-containing protein At4g08210 isoform X1 [Cannabis sativa]|uniref:pentatricopeptide repeat-containing protein At4g08210 isoform X1 n=2 Tax=Cannabis sativa TaxID=3483 RepID=UPI0029CA641A|nr:pentatricopeptide repeat-containing protein At4g08210 isoform X1 [Cannabis sativa]
MELNSVAKALRHCGRVGAFNPGKVLHSHLFKLGMFNDMFLANNLISMYMKFKFLKDARKVFDEMPVKNIVTWTTMVSAYADCGTPREALGLYTRMLDSKSDIPNGFMYSAVLKACGLLGDLKFGKMIHEGICNDGLESDTVLMNTLLDMYVKCGSLSNAKAVFDEILFANSTTWNTIISGYSKSGLMNEAVDLFQRMPEPNVVSWNSIIAGFADKGSLRASEFLHEMHREGFKLDGFTFPCALKTCGRHGLLEFGEQIHCYVIRSGFESGRFTVSALVDMYSDCNKLISAKKLFKQYSSCNSSICDNLALWNSMLSGYVVNMHNKTALDLVSIVHRSGAVMDSYTFSAALKACINLLNSRLGLQVHGLVVTSGHEFDHVVGSVLVDLYARVGKINHALQLFHILPKKDIVAWSGLITGCSKMGFSELALSLFRNMHNLNLEVDQFVVSSILKVCSTLTSLRNGKQIHAFCTKKGYDHEGVVITSLIDMYTKCGEIEDGLALFESTTDRDTVCWTGIIVGCGQNGRAKEAIQYFHEMRESGMKPNEITYLCVLSACRHAGLVKEAQAIFSSMKLEYGLEPLLEHYNCMIDLLSQAGCFKEAEKLIADMPCEANETIWRSLLGACGTYKNAELLNVIDKNILATLPEDSSTYVTLSNVYAELGMWDSLCKARKTAKEVGSKEAGKSWIEITS